MTTPIPLPLSEEELKEIGRALYGRFTLVLQNGKEVTGAALMDHISAQGRTIKAFGTAEGNDLRFMLAKKLAVKAIQEERQRDPDNCLVQDMERHLLGAKTVAELDALLRDEHEDDWVEGYVLARMEELVDEITGAFTLSSHHLPPTGKE